MKFKNSIFSIFLIFLLFTQELHTFQLKKNGTSAIYLKSKSSSKSKPLFFRSIESKSRKNKIEPIITGTLIIAGFLLGAATYKIIAEGIARKQLKLLTDERNNIRKDYYLTRLRESQIFLSFCSLSGTLNEFFSLKNFYARSTLRELKQDLQNNKDNGQNSPALTENVKMLENIAQNADYLTISACYNTYEKRGTVDSGFPSLEVFDTGGNFYSGEAKTFWQKTKAFVEEGIDLLKGAAPKAATTVLEADSKHVMIDNKPTVNVPLVDEVKNLGITIFNIYKFFVNCGELFESKSDKTIWAKLLEYLTSVISGAEKIVGAIQNVEKLLGNSKVLNIPFVSTGLLFVQMIKGFNEERELTNQNAEYAKQQVPYSNVTLILKHAENRDLTIDALDSLVNMILLFIIPATWGTLIAFIGNVKLLMSVFRMVSVTMKNVEIYRIKKEFLENLHSMHKDNKEHFQAMEKVFRLDNCVQLKVLMIDSINGEIENLVTNSKDKQNFMQKLKEDFDSNKIDEKAIEDNIKELIKDICENNPDLCHQFLETFNYDQSFIEKDVELMKIIKEARMKLSIGKINSIIAVRKSHEGFKLGEEEEYTKTMIQTLFSSGYVAVGQSPKVDIFACRGCLGNKKTLKEIKNFQKYSEIKEFAAKNPQLTIQESIQSINMTVLEKKDVESKKINDMDITEFFVGLLEPADSSKQFQEIIYNENIVGVKDFHIDNINWKVQNKPFQSLDKFNLMICSVHEDGLPEFYKKSKEMNEFLILSTQAGIKKGTKFWVKDKEQNHHFFLVATSLAKPIDDVKKKHFCTFLTSSDGKTQIPLELDRRQYYFTINDKDSKFCSIEDDHSQFKADFLGKKENGWTKVTNDKNFVVLNMMDEKKRKTCKFDFFYKELYKKPEGKY